MTLSMNKKDEFKTLTKKHSLNTTLIRILLSGLTMLFFAFAPIGLNQSQIILLIISAGLGFLGNIIATLLIYRENVSIGMLLSIFSFNLAYLGISFAYQNLGGLTFLLILVPSTLLIFAFFQGNIRNIIFTITNLIAIIAIFFDYLLSDYLFRIYLSEDILQLIYTLYVVLIVFITAIYLRNYLKVNNYFTIKDRIIANQTLTLTLGLSFVLLLVFSFNYIKSINIYQDKTISNIQTIEDNFNSFIEKQNSSIQLAAESSIYTNYIENDYVDNLTEEDQTIIQTSLDSSKGKTGLQGNDFIAAIIDGDGNLLAISDANRLNFFNPNDFTSPEMHTSPTISDIKLSSNPNFAYIYFTHPIENRFSTDFSNGILIYGFNYSILGSLINDISTINELPNFSVLYDNNFIQLFHGKEPSYNFTLAKQADQTTIQDLIESKKLPIEYNPEQYPQTESFNQLIASFIDNTSDSPVFDAIYETTDLNTEYFAGIKKINTPIQEFYLSGFIPYTQVHQLINQNILIYFVLATILILSFLFLTNRYPEKLETRFDLTIKEMKSYLNTDIFQPLLFAEQDEITSITTKLFELSQKNKTTIQNQELQYIEELSQLNGTINHLHDATEIMNDLSQYKTPQSLFLNAVNQIKEYFNFYHVAILLYKNNYLEYIVGTGSEGILFKNSNYKVDVNANIPISLAYRKKYGISGSLNNVFMKHPILEDSRDEIAIPIHSNNQIIGILNIHTKQSNFFSSNQFFIFQNIANSIGAYFYKTKTINQISEQLNDKLTALQSIRSEDWDNFKYQYRNKNKGYKYHLFDTTELDQDNEICRIAWELKRVVISNNFQALKNIYPNTAAFPISIREQVINVLAVSFDSEESMNRNIPIITSITQNLGYILDNLRIVDQTQSQLNLTNITDQIIDQVFRSSSVDDILKTLTNSLSEALDVTEVEVQIRQTHSSLNHNNGDSNV